MFHTNRPKCIYCDATVSNIWKFPKKFSVGNAFRSNCLAILLWLQTIMNAWKTMAAAIGTQRASIPRDHTNACVTMVSMATATIAEVGEGSTKMTLHVRLFSQISNPVNSQVKRVTTQIRRPFSSYRMHGFIAWALYTCHRQSLKQDRSVSGEKSYKPNPPTRSAP